MKVILIIDDDRSFLELIEAQLLNERFRVFTADSGEEGIKTALSLNPDLVICDINMPGMNGLEVLKNFRRDEITKNIPVIMVTAVDKKETVYTAMRYNIFDYIIKPYSKDMLLQKINTAIHFSDIKKNNSITEKGQNIIISRGPESIIISFKIKLHAETIIKEAKDMFNEFFFRSLAGKRCIIDLRSLSQFDVNDAKMLGIIIKLFGTRELLIVAGRHYGEMVSYLDFDDIDFGEKIHFFISFGDMEIFLKKTH